jgi:hypothetical protein
MWVFLASLNPLFSYSLLVLTIIALVIIALRGKLFVQWGKDKVIGVGKGDKKEKETKESNKEDKDSIGTVTETYIIPSCSDCILLVLGMREKAQMAMDKVENHILKDQMNFCEQKLAELTSIILNEFTKVLDKKEVPVNESLRYEIFRSLLFEITDRIKSEIRRSFKENGFYEYVDGEFSNYINNRCDYIETISEQHYGNRYLAYSSVLPSDLISKIFYENKDRIASIVREVYTTAKSVKSKASEDMDIEKQTFATEVKEFVKSRKLPII